MRQILDFSPQGRHNHRIVSHRQAVSEAESRRKASRHGAFSRAGFYPAEPVEHTATQPEAIAMPKVLNKHRDKIPPNAVYVGRPSQWGNPFVLGKDGDRDTVIEKFREYLNSRPDLQAQARAQLGGRDLVCFCAPQPCHADVLLAIANPSE